MRTTVIRSDTNDENCSGIADRCPSVGGWESVVALPFGRLFEGSDDGYYTDWQVTKRLRTGEWSLCMRQRSPDRWLVETRDGALLLLTPAEPDELPAGIEIRVSDSRARVVDTRPTSPK